MNFIRGDTFKFKSLIKFKDGQVILKEDMKELFVTIKKSEYSSNIIFQKTLDDIEIDATGYIHVEFRPSDTETLDYGKYLGDIEITLVNGTRKTKVFDFELLAETTFHGGDAT